MIIRRGFKYRLKVDASSEASMRLYSGHRRFVYNYFLRLNLRRLHNAWGILWYNEMEWHLSKLLMASEEYRWLSDAPKVVLQQSLRDLERAFKDAFDREQPNKRIPTFKKKTESQTFRYPQIRLKQKDGSYQYNLKVDNRRVWLPKIGWVGFHKSREVVGDVKNVTVSRAAGHWYVSIQTETQVDNPNHPSGTVVGCDRGVAVPFAFSDGTKGRALRAFKKHENQLSRLQRTSANKVKFSNNWHKTQDKIRKLHSTIASVRKDYLHKLSASISNNHAIVYLEDLRIGNMTKRAKPKPSADGSGFERNGASAKTGLNKSVLDVGWGMFSEFLTYKQTLKGGYVAYVPAPWTSQTCVSCGHIAKDNRQTQARFHCAECGFQANADWVASVNIETRGQAGRFARKSHDAGPGLIEFGRGFVCGSTLHQQRRMQKVAGSREAVPPSKA